MESHCDCEVVFYAVVRKDNAFNKARSNHKLNFGAKAYLEWVSCRYSVAKSREPPRAAHTNPKAMTATDAAPLLGSCSTQNSRCQLLGIKLACEAVQAVLTALVVANVQVTSFSISWSRWNCAGNTWLAPADGRHAYHAGVPSR